MSNVSIGTFSWDKTAWLLQVLRASCQSGFPHLQIKINVIKTPIPDHCRVLNSNSLGGGNWYQRHGRLVDLAVSKLFSPSCLLLLSLIFQQTMVHFCRIFRS